MADDQERIKRPDGTDKALRRARDRYNSRKTQLALNDAVLDVPGATIFDSQRVIWQLGKNLHHFKHAKGFQEFRSQVVTWAIRQASLTVMLRTMLPRLEATSHVQTILFARLPEFAGTDEEFADWVVETAAREQNGAEALALWISEHRASVRRGIRRVLRHCSDLGISAGQGGESYPMDELETQVWRDIAYQTEEILRSTEPISRQLWWKGFWAASAWKTSRQRERQQRDDRFLIGFNGVERVTKEDDGNEINVDAEVVNLADFNTVKLVERLWNGEDAERRWKQADLDRDLHRAGPFRVGDADDYQSVMLHAA